MGPNSIASTGKDHDDTVVANHAEDNTHCGADIHHKDLTYLPPLECSPCRLGFDTAAFIGFQGGS